MGRNASTEDLVYHIRVLGRLEEGGTRGFAVARRATGETLLSGPGVDPAALERVLDPIRRQGLPLLLVARADCPCTSKRCARHGNCVECAAHYAGNGKLPFCFRERSKWEKKCAAVIGAQ